jgi:hypothetical protein
MMMLAHAARIRVPLEPTEPMIYVKKEKAQHKLSSRHYTDILQRVSVCIINTKNIYTQTLQEGRRRRACHCGVCTPVN